MKNTFIQLSIAFIGNDGRILNVTDMAPKDERTHWSNGPAQYALEMRKLVCRARNQRRRQGRRSPAAKR
jgi:uncharacterized membrane protein (UPF0127 family)